MKYVMIIALFMINNVFAEAASNAHKNLQDFITKNQAQLEQEIRDEKQKNEQTIERLKVVGKGLEFMGRIVAAFNGKKTSDEEATKLAQQAFVKIYAILGSEQWQKIISMGIYNNEKFKAQMAVVNQINEFCDEQISKNPAKDVEYKAQRAIICAILSKMSPE